MARIIVTGGAGFIGSVLVNRLMKDYSSYFDALVVVDKLTYAANLENLEETSKSKKFRLEVADLVNFQEIDSLIQDNDQIFHLAAESHVDNSISSGGVFWQTNTLATANILEIMKNRKGVRLLYISTDEVYGSIDEGSFSELSPLNPSSPYSASKAGGDLACLAYLKTHNLDLNVTRCCNNFGIEQHPEKLLPVLIRNVNAHQPVPIYGDGKNVREWIPAWAHAEYLIRLMFSNIRGEVFNIGSGLELNNLETASMVASVLQKELRVNFVEDRKAHDFRYSVDYSKIKRALGILTYDPLEELARTIHNFAGLR